MAIWPIGTGRLNCIEVCGLCSGGTHSVLANSGSFWTAFRNLLGSMRWDTSNGNSPSGDALYDPYGNEWYVCTIYSSGVSSFVLFDPYCTCYAAAVGPDGRPYYPGLGRSMSPRPFGGQDPFDTQNQNAYAYGDNDPMNTVDPCTGDPSNPPLPGQDQAGAGNDVPPGLDIWHCPTCMQQWRAADAAGNFLAAGRAAEVAAPYAAEAVPYAAEQAPSVLPQIEEWVGQTATNASRSVGAAAETYVRGGVQAVTDFAAGFVNSTMPPSSWAGQLGAAVSNIITWWSGQ